MLLYMKIIIISINYGDMTSGVRMACSVGKPPLSNIIPFAKLELVHHGLA